MEEFGVGHGGVRDGAFFSLYRSGRSWRLQSKTLPSRLSDGFLNAYGFLNLAGWGER
jgi:hypothetical protein